MKKKKNRYKICVYAICKNEEAFAQRWMDSVSEADLVVVLDTGSTDRTAAILKAAGARVYSEKIDPWRFDTARNRALSHVPSHYDICVSNDVDEVFEPGWRQKLEDAWTSDTTQARYHFVWNHFENGAPDKIFDMEKIHSRHGYRWVHPVHEILHYEGDIPEKKIFIPNLLLHHYPDPGKPRSQYLPLLELSAQENPDDDRTIFWLGREYSFYGEHQKCIDTLTRYLHMPGAVWDEERSAAMRYIAQSCEALGKFTEQRKWLLRSAAEAQDVREPYLHLAKLGYRENDWILTFWAVSEGLKIAEKSGSYLLEPEAWNGSLEDYGAIASFRLGDYQTALKYAQSASTMQPDNPRLRQNLELIYAAQQTS